MLRFGERVKKNITYKRRVGAYGIIEVKGSLILTKQIINEHTSEIQLPGGGLESNETLAQALVREAYEETGWRVYIKRKIGCYQRFVFMPEYNIWAHKICHIFFCQGILKLAPPSEKNHSVLLVSPKIAPTLLESSGDQYFVKKIF